MRALRVIVGAAAILLTVAGCGNDQAAPADQAASSSESATASPPPSSLPPGQPGEQLPTPPAKPAPPQGGAVLPENQADTSGLPPFYEQKEIVVAPDGNSVTVWGMARDACSRVTGEVEESAEVVRIVLVPMPAPQGGPADQVCAQVLTPVPVTVQLKSPLGNRKVVVSEKETY